MELFRVRWCEPILRELHDGRIVWVMQMCERWGITREQAEQIAMDVKPIRVAIMAARLGWESYLVGSVARFDDKLQIDRFYTVVGTKEGE